MDIMDKKIIIIINFIEPQKEILLKCILFCYFNTKLNRYQFAVTTLFFFIIYILLLFSCCSFYVQLQVLRFLRNKFSNICKKTQNKTNEAHRYMSMYKVCCFFYVYFNGSWILKRGKRLLFTHFHGELKLMFKTKMAKNNK